MPFHAKQILSQQSQFLLNQGWYQQENTIVFSPFDMICLCKRTIPTHVEPRAKDIPMLKSEHSILV